MSKVFKNCDTGHTFITGKTNAGKTKPLIDLFSIDVTSKLTDENIRALDRVTFVQDVKGFVADIKPQK